MSPYETPETLVRQVLEVEPSAADREIVWESIVERLVDPPSRRRVPAMKRLTRLAVPALAALVATLAAIALLPAGDERGRSSAPAPATASAAEVLTATARSAHSALPAVGPGEYLFARTSLTITGEGPVSVDTRSWTATDGSARIVDVERARRRVRDAKGKLVEKWQTETTVTTYHAGSARGVVAENGVERPTLPPELSPNWRYVVPGDEVTRLPPDRDALLASLRARAGRAAELYGRPRPEGYYPRVDRTYELAGPDMLVVETATALLVEAPLNPAQRTAMLSMLADAANWYRPGTSAEPIEIRNLGQTEDALGRDGIALKFTMEVTSDEIAGASSQIFDLVLDPQDGRLLEIRSYEHGPGADPVLRTVASQRVVDSMDG
jgi:hypothetical protein